MTHWHSLRVLFLLNLKEVISLIICSLRLTCTNFRVGIPSLSIVNNTEQVETARLYVPRNTSSGKKEWQLTRIAHVLGLATCSLLFVSKPLFTMHADHES